MADIDWLSYDQNDVSVNLSFSNTFSEYLSDRISKKLKDKLNEIDDIWRFVGLPYEHREQQSDEIEQKILNVINEILLKNQKFRDDGLKYRDYKLQEINKILNDLSLESFQLLECGETKTLIMQNQILQRKFNELMVIKQERMMKLERLENQLKNISRLLGISYQPTQFITDIPNEKELASLASILNGQEKLLSERKQIYESYRMTIDEFIDRLEYQPQNDDEKSLITRGKDEIIYSNLFLNKLTAFLNKLSNLNETTRLQIVKKQEILDQLYNRLDIDVDERKNFQLKLQQCPSLTAQQLLLQNKINELEIMKKSCMKKIIQNIRTEMKSLAAKCHASNIDNYLMNSEDFTEELLDELEKEYERLKNYYESYEEVFAKLIDFEETSEKLIELERKSTDPNRFNNRGGALLQMERDRKLYSKKLPKLEKEIRLLIDMIENEKEIYFASYGMNIGEYFERSRQQLKDCKLIVNNNVAPTITTTLGSIKQSSKTHQTSSATKRNIRLITDSDTKSDQKPTRLAMVSKDPSENSSGSDIHQPLPRKIAKRNLNDDINKMVIDEPEKLFQNGIKLRSTMARNDEYYNHIPMIPHLDLDYSPMKRNGIVIKPPRNHRNNHVGGRRRSKSVDFATNRLPMINLDINSNNNNNPSSTTTTSSSSKSSCIQNVKTIQYRRPFLP